MQVTSTQSTHTGVQVVSILKVGNYKRRQQIVTLNSYLWINRRIGPLISKKSRLYWFLCCQNISTNYWGSSRPISRPITNKFYIYCNIVMKDYHPVLINKQTDWESTPTLHLLSLHLPSEKAEVLYLPKSNGRSNSWKLRSKPYSTELTNN